MKPTNILHSINESNTIYQQRLDDILDQIVALMDDVKDIKPKMYAMLDKVETIISEYDHYNLNEEDK